MLETSSERLSQRGGPHFGSPDKLPGGAARDHCCRRAAAVPFTSGLLIGIGETRRERIEALLLLRALHRALRPSARDHHPEFPRQARHPDGAACRARARRAPLDHRGRAHPVRRRHDHSGAAQSAAGLAQRLDRGRHQRLGRRVAGHARSRQPGAAMAAARCACARDRRRWQGSDGTARGLSSILSSARSNGWTPALHCARAAD